MRITNTMMSNRMMLNINRNVSQVDTLYNKLSTGKEIQVPSDNPILAARALKFRTNVKETQQYQKNVQQGISWMEISEQGFSNVNLLTERIRELCVQGSSDSYSYEDRKKIITDINSLVDQIGLEMNITYTGRYVFSGYRTDKPPVLETDSPDLYAITQNFTINDLQDTKSYQRLDNATEPLINDVNVMKLAYKNIEPGTIVASPTAYVISEKSLLDTDAYTPTTGVNYIKETGELVFSSTAKVQLETTPFSVTYEKSGLTKGELNPEVYFTCTNITTGQSYTMDHQQIEYEVGINSRMQINSLAKDIYTDKMYSDLKNFVDIVNTVQLSDVSMLNVKYGGDQEKIQDQLTNEKQRLQGVLQDRFSDVLAQLDRHGTVVAKQHADLGTKMSRLELVENRLQEDELTYTKLLSQNEDADYMKVVMFLKSAESVYNASLQMGANIIQTTLANFIR